MIATFPDFCPGFYVGFCQQVLEKCSKFSVRMGANVIGSAPNFLRTKVTNICAIYIQCRLQGCKDFCINEDKQQGK